ncbi:hypothetical protein JR316_0000224 [Psilocybe cubensis]|uniref:Uncharacterized protein n=2 Tax=Psilocybe cubensis TaxID=181762 RepID=A0A8H7Y4G2_PSICU|nr:hypothetical protein JR316_0000224 [Psilocybe cubensis]KAH9486160.1 hypothetical protein JR316_0000224 [Psilocybe cubensis]
MAPAAIKITYDLKPPAGVDYGDKPTQKSQEFPIDASSGGDANNTAFYTALRASLDKARIQVGEEVTAWRDVIGKAELNKEPKKVVSEEDEEEEEEEA